MRTPITKSLFGYTDVDYVQPHGHIHLLQPNSWLCGVLNLNFLFINYSTCTIDGQSAEAQWHHLWKAAIVLLPYTSLLMAATQWEKEKVNFHWQGPTITILILPPLYLNSLLGMCLLHLKLCKNSAEKTGYLAEYVAAHGPHPCIWTGS